MSQPVIIKSNQYGIHLILDPDLPFEELLDRIIEKFTWNSSRMPMWQFPLAEGSCPGRRNTGL